MMKTIASLQRSAKALLISSAMLSVIWNTSKAISFLSIALISTQTVLANNTSVSVPTVLKNARIETQTDIAVLMKSPQLANEFYKLATKLDQMQINDMQFDSELGLRSILNQNQQLLSLIENNPYPSNQYHYVLLAKASTHYGNTLNSDLKKIASKALTNASDLELYKLSQPMGWSLELGRDYLLWLFQRFQNANQLTSQQALQLLSNYQLYKVYERVLPIVRPILEAEQDRRYEIKPNILVKTSSGATISAIVVRKKNDIKKRPAAFRFSIYADEKWDTLEAIHAAARGYIGVVAYTRGKAHSPDKIVPWEHDGKDANAIINWITKQSWSDGQVAMYGGSYLGFTQWAAAKYMHPALKTIVPYAAAHPFTGLPVENNIFMTANYQWSFHVTNNKTMDQTVYANPKHWQNLYSTLFESGRAFKDIDKIDGMPNPWFQKLLKHPSYDKFYQDMLPYETDYKKINIPVLSITGYFDGASISAIDFMKRHYQFNPNAEHYLLTGPYTHGTAQGIPRSHYGKYKLDDVALKKDTKEVTFQWFDHVLFGKPKPDLIKDKVNYQLMGSNLWRHKPSYSELNQKHKTFHLSKKDISKEYYSLTTKPVSKNTYFEQEIDLTDRTIQRNQHSWQFIHETLPNENGLAFSTAPLLNDFELAGEITGHFSIAINKKDVDIGFKLYEVTSSGESFLLTRYISRASYAEDMSKRKLLQPNKKTIIPIINSRMLGKLINEGSKIVLVLNVNKNSGAQVNMGTGKDVSTETIDDATSPLLIKWYADSKINIPLKAL